RLGDFANLRAVEVTLVAKRNENSDHGCLPWRTDRKASCAGRCPTSYSHFAFASDDFVANGENQPRRTNSGSFGEAYVRENSAWRGLGIEHRSDSRYSIAQLSSD